MGNEANNEKKPIGIKLEELLKDIWGSLTDEQKEKMKERKSWDEMMSYAGKENIELPDELLDAVSGGYILPEYNEQEDRWTYFVINDNNGNQEGGYYVLEWAQDAAREKGFSTDFITHEEYHNLRDKHSGC